MRCEWRHRLPQRNCICRGFHELTCRTYRPAKIALGHIINDCMLRYAMTTKFTISSLPLPPASRLLTHNLTVDRHTADLRKVLRENPSIQRRARLLPPEAHYAHLSPFPMSFPYDIQSPEGDEDVTDKAQFIENWLADREAVKPQSDRDGSLLNIFTPNNRDNRRELIGLSETGLRDCLPHLQVGDAFTLLGSPSLIPEDEPEPETSLNEHHVSARKELIDVLGGHAMLMSEHFAPWSLRYSGHQFGSWAGQLGDGRAVSIRWV